VEILSRYYSIGLAARDEAVYQPTADLLGTVGRMKYVRPLYTRLAACDRKLAEATFEKNRSFYHPICRNMVIKDFKDSE
jgi:leukotriene-A4 hydrolase